MYIRTEISVRHSFLQIDLTVCQNSGQFIIYEQFRVCIFHSRVEGDTEDSQSKWMLYLDFGQNSDSKGMLISVAISIISELEILPRI